MMPEHQMHPEQAKRVDMSRAADELLGQHRRGEIILGDRARELASFLFLPSLDPEVRSMFRRVRDLRRESGMRETAEIKQIMDDVHERIDRAAEELTELLDATPSQP